MVIAPPCGAATRSEALRLAKTLREEGFWVIVTGPDGETIDETEDEPKPG